MLQSGSALAATGTDKFRGFNTSRYGKGPALEGPYINLGTGKGNKLAYARIQGDLDNSKEILLVQGLLFRRSSRQTHR
ncbi:MAG: hypothetical protein R3F24_06060 [Gammaproteobacteria bacterium]